MFAQQKTSIISFLFSTPFLRPLIMKIGVGITEVVATTPYIKIIYYFRNTWLKGLYLDMMVCYV